ncbi:MAG: hypothetical protein R6V47_03380 [Candidatus Delongbacteria bacterium]
MEQENTGISASFLELLRYADRLLNETIRGLTSDVAFSTLVLLVVISFLYGILHSIGPGHGKALVASFFLKEKHRLKRAFTLAGIVALVHTGSAIILSILLYFVLTGVKGMFRIRLQSYFIGASGILITTIGLLFLFFKIYSKGKKKEEGKIELSGKSNLILVGAAAGIVPCPVASMLMLLTLSHGIVHIGLLAVAGISAGMFFLLSLIGLLTIKSRDGIMALSEKKFKRSETVSTVIEYVSVGLIILIGLGMSSSLLLNMFGQG